MCRFITHPLKAPPISGRGSTIPPKPSSCPIPPFIISKKRVFAATCGDSIQDDSPPNKRTRELSCMDTDYDRAVLESHTKIARVLATPSSFSTTRAGGHECEYVSQWRDMSMRRRKKRLAQVHCHSKRFLEQKGVWEGVADILDRHFTTVIAESVGSTPSYSNTREEGFADSCSSSTSSSSSSIASSMDDDGDDDQSVSSLETAIVSNKSEEMQSLLATSAKKEPPQTLPMPHHQPGTPPTLPNEAMDIFQLIRSASRSLKEVRETAETPKPDAPVSNRKSAKLIDSSCLDESSLMPLNYQRGSLPRVTLHEQKPSINSTNSASKSASSQSQGRIGSNKKPNKMSSLSTRLLQMNSVSPDSRTFAPVSLSMDEPIKVPIQQPTSTFLPAWCRPYAFHNR
eukprot:scaffold1224_cov136-Amphora_coffeaeformis.AAC.2